MPAPGDRKTSLTDAARLVRERLGVAPACGVVLGSGLGAFADRLGDARSLSTATLPGFPRSTVKGHEGRLVAGRLGEVTVLVQKGRVHRYEGYALDDVCAGVRLFAELGARGVLLSNAAGALTTRLVPGDLMLAVDHVDLSLGRRAPGSALAKGWERAALPPRGRREAYTSRLLDHARDAAQALAVPIREGVLVHTLGPMYETAREVSWYRMAGGDAACMSTVPEANAVRALGLETLALSCITNLGTGLETGPLDHADVTVMARRALEPFGRLLAEIVGRAYGPSAP